MRIRIADMNSNNKTNCSGNYNTNNINNTITIFSLKSNGAQNGVSKVSYVLLIKFLI